MYWRRALLGLRWLLLTLLVVVLLAPEWPAFGDPRYRLRTIVGPEERFDFIRWTLDTLGVKAEGILTDTHAYLPSEAEKTFVLDYLDRIHAVQRLEGEIERLYADPAIADPAAAAAGKQAEVDAIRRELAMRQPLAEGIVQRQVATLLREEGLAMGGVTWPPVLMTMSPVPYMLIVSPRDRIQQVDYAALVPGLATDTKEMMEDAVFARLGHSALVVPIGGLGTYPAMIRETSSMNWLAEVTAHEWTHHWLSLRPLGVRYLESPALRTMNETVASIVDLEIGPKVIERYYPELAPPPETPPTGLPAVPEDPPVFDFRVEMAETRNEVDRLLAAGKIEEAEAYMERRRQVFVANGYALRKLNQAYFAFYGGYAAEPGGAAGADPIGPMLRRIRAESPSLRAFLDAVGGLTSYEELLSLYERVVGEDPATIFTQ
jgi:hypothetical protein